MAKIFPDYKFRTVLIGLFFLLSTHVPASYADTQNEERFSAPAINNQPTPTAKKIANNFLTYPFEIPRWLGNAGLNFVEKNRLDSKTMWIYQKIVDQGITPYGSFVSASNLGGGMDIDWVRLTRQKVHAPDLIAKSWLNWNKSVNFESGAQVGLERIAGSHFRLIETAKYESRPEEHFDGIGPHTSAGNGTSFKIETTSLETKLGYQPNPVFSGDIKFSYKNVNITDGEDGGRGIIDTTFPIGSIPGLAGDQLLEYGIDLSHDTRDHDETSTRGGQEKINFSYNKGLQDSNAQYLKYEIEISRYIPLWSNRRIFAIHFYGEQNTPTGEHEVPFHQMSRLGGHGSFPSLSHPLRAYDDSRFFDRGAVLLNFEYRYNIWEYRDFKLDAVIFEDEGQVFRNPGKFRFKDLRESYGGGLRASIASNIVLSIEAAHGDEGTIFYVRSRSPF